MTIRHLKIFLAVAESGKMSLAAEQLFITQPSVSQAIRELEEHYQTLLFERLSKSSTSQRMEKSSMSLPNSSSPSLKAWRRACRRKTAGRSSVSAARLPLAAESSPGWCGTCVQSSPTLISILI
ncbi:LysR family transcriptional regulator [Blautia sp. RD014234]|nr:LysR family transcriptional regulator [Blautia parvula]